MTNPNPHELVVWLVHRHDRSHCVSSVEQGDHVETTAYATRDEAQIVADLLGEDLDCAVVHGGLAFTADEWHQISKGMLGMSRLMAAHDPAVAKACADLGRKAAQMSFVEICRDA
jgi:sugar (pentulose or hexulose) kinase